MVGGVNGRFHFTGYLCGFVRPQRELADGLVPLGYSGASANLLASRTVGDTRKRPRSARFHGEGSLFAEHPLLLPSFFHPSS